MIDSGRAESRIKELVKEVEKCKRELKSPNCTDYHKQLLERKLEAAKDGIFEIVSWFAN